MGILTDQPQYQLDISASPINKGIRTPQLILTSVDGISASNVDNFVYINSNTNINADLLCNKITSITGTSYIRSLDSDKIKIEILEARDANTDISINSNILFTNGAMINSDLSVNGDISVNGDLSLNGDMYCNILTASNLNIKEISGDISFIGNFDFSGKVIIDGSLNSMSWFTNYFYKYYSKFIG